MKDQHLHADASPTTLSPGYIADFNPEEDDEDHEEDRADYPADRGDNDDNESSDDDDDDDDETMKTVNQGMSVKEIKRVRMLATRGSGKVTTMEARANKTKGIRNYKKVGHIIQNCRTTATARNQRTHTCYECGSLRHYKSKCPIVKFQKRVDMIL
nr:hypothetical protein [Tanacetum cinerariifolium]